MTETTETKHTVRRLDDGDLAGVIRPLAVIALGYASEVARSGPKDTPAPDLLKTDMGLAAVMATAVSTFDSLVFAAGELNEGILADNATALWDEAVETDEYFAYLAGLFTTEQTTHLQTVLDAITSLPEEVKVDTLASALTILVLSYALTQALATIQGLEAVTEVIAGIHDEG